MPEQERLSYPDGGAYNYTSSDMELARLRGYEMAVKDMARNASKPLDEHRYVYLNGSGGVCACGKVLSWYGLTISPDVALGAHITEAKT